MLLFFLNEDFCLSRLQYVLQNMEETGRCQKKNGDWYSIDMRLIYLPNPTFSQVQNFGHRKHEMLPLYLHHLTYLLQKQNIKTGQHFQDVFVIGPSFLGRFGASPRFFVEDTWQLRLANLHLLGRQDRCEKALKFHDSFVGTELAVKKYDTNY